MFKCFYRPKFTLFLILITLFNLGSAKNGYFPNATDLSWTYSNGQELRMTGPYELDDYSHPIMVIANYMNGQIISEDYMVYDESGVFQLATLLADGELLQYNPPLTLFEGSTLSPGQTWESSTYVNNKEIRTRYEVVRHQGIKTELGRFNTFLIKEQTFTATGAHSELEIYFVPGIGIIRRSSSKGDVTDLVKKNF